jgi:hypothetical protein
MSAAAAVLSDVFLVAVYEYVYSGFSKQKQQRQGEQSGV